MGSLLALFHVNRKQSKLSLQDERTSELLLLNANCSENIIVKTSQFSRDDDEVRFVLDQHA